MENTQTNIPETITLGGVTYSVKDTPELMAIVGAASQREKNKLHSTAESLRKQIEALSNTKLEEGAEAQQSMQAYFDERFKSMQELFTKQITDSINPLIEASKRSAQESIDAYRERLIKENFDKCIPEIVAGNTKEEILESLNKSIKIREAYSPKTPNPQVVDNTVKNAAPNANQQKPLEQKVEQQLTPPIPPVPQANINPSAGGANPLDGLKSMSMQDFVKNRDSLLESLKANFGN